MFDNKFAFYTCQESGKRIAVSNNIPDHNVEIGNPNQPCECNVWIEMPLDPQKTTTKTEPVDLGFVAIAKNGVVIYGAQEGGGTNAAEPGSGAQITDAQYWWGHAATDGDWHYHNPMAGSSSYAGEDELVGYAFDGFPIYGPVADVSTLDECNMDAQNRYHVRTLEQVDGDASYCSGTSAAINWDYTVGCYWGDLAGSAVLDSSTQTLPSDCVLDASMSNNADQLCTATNIGQCGETQEGGMETWMLAAAGAAAALFLALIVCCACRCGPCARARKEGRADNGDRMGRMA
jgi:hypothetical protein